MPVKEKYAWAFSKTHFNQVSSQIHQDCLLRKPTLKSPSTCLTGSWTHTGCLSEGKPTFPWHGNPSYRILGKDLKTSHLKMSISLGFLRLLRRKKMIAVCVIVINVLSADPDYQRGNWVATRQRAWRTFSLGGTRGMGRTYLVYPCLW